MIPSQGSHPPNAPTPVIGLSPVSKAAETCVSVAGFPSGLDGVGPEVPDRVPAQTVTPTKSSSRFGLEGRQTKSRYEHSVWSGTGTAL
jgi:hypothetical protein